MGGTGPKRCLEGRPGGPAQFPGTARLALSLAGALVWAAVFSACAYAAGGAAPVSPGSPPPTETTASVGAGGARVATPDGSLVLDIPAGAFAATVQVRVYGLSGSQAPPLPGALTPAAVWSIDTGGVEPIKPVAATFAYDPKVLEGGNPARVGVYLYDPAGARWTWAGGMVNAAADTVTVNLPYLGTCAVLANTTVFEDLGQVPWARKAVDSLLGADMVAGTAPGVFDPNQPMTRAEFVVLVDQVVGVRPGSPAGLPFTDVPPAAWYAPYVAAAYRSGIAAGVSAAAFDPSGPVTRQEAAVLLIRAMGYRHVGSPVGTLPAKPPTFTDQGRIAAWASTDVVRATEFGLIHGYPDGSFRPTASLTRAQGAVLAAGVLQDVELARQGILPE